MRSLLRPVVGVADERDAEHRRRQRRGDRRQTEQHKRPRRGGSSSCHSSCGRHSGRESVASLYGSTSSLASSDHASAVGAAAAEIAAVPGAAAGAVGVRWWPSRRCGCVGDQRRALGRGELRVRCGHDGCAQLLESRCTTRDCGRRADGRRRDAGRWHAVAFQAFIKCCKNSDARGHQRGRCRPTTTSASTARARGPDGRAAVGIPCST